MNLSNGKRILWVGHRFPPRGDPPCTDPMIISEIEARKGFGAAFWQEKSPDEILIYPAAVPKDCETDILEKAAKRLVELGVNVNPKFLIEDEEEEVERPEEPPQLPSKTIISNSKKKELIEVVERFGWDIDLDLSAKDLKKAIREKIDELSP